MHGVGVVQVDSWRDGLPIRHARASNAAAPPTVNLDNPDPECNLCIDDVRLPNAVFIDELFAQSLGVARIGDEIELQGQRAVVRGFTRGVRLEVRVAMEPGFQAPVGLQVDVRIFCPCGEQNDPHG